MYPPFNNGIPPYYMNGYPQTPDMNRMKYPNSKKAFKEGMRFMQQWKEELDKKGDGKKEDKKDDKPKDRMFSRMEVLALLILGGPPFGIAYALLLLNMFKAVAPMFR